MHLSHLLKEIRLPLFILTCVSGVHTLFCYTTLRNTRYIWQCR